MPKIEKKDVEGCLQKATESKHFCVMNDVLYCLCEQDIAHCRDDVILAKVWLIGRSYAAAIERGRGDSDLIDNDTFYIEKVAKGLRESKIGVWFSELSELENYSNTDKIVKEQVLKMHCRLQDEFHKMNKEKKNFPSLASKYLHFHFPSLFFIYDTRACSVIGDVLDAVGMSRRQNSEFQGKRRNYANFYEKCLRLQTKLQEDYGKELKPREIDDFLLEVEKLRKDRKNEAS